MRVSITCEECGERHRLDRRITEPGPIWIVCHSCEMPLHAVLEGPVTAPRDSRSVWAGIFEMPAVEKVRP